MNLKERIKQLEAQLDSEIEEEVLVIMGIDTPEDLRELPDSPEEWLTYEPALARTPPALPGCIRSVHLYADEERRARALATEN